MPLILGGFLFSDFEIPEHIPLGGAHTVSKKTLLGGARVVDAMGPDDRDIQWTGRFQGLLAWQRARIIDSMRIAGQPLPLLIDTEFRMVVITEFLPNYERSYQVPYSITCMVVSTGGGLFGVLDTLDLVIASDLTSISTQVANSLSF